MVVASRGPRFDVAALAAAAGATGSSAQMREIDVTCASWKAAVFCTFSTVMPSR